MPKFAGTRRGNGPLSLEDIFWQFKFRSFSWDFLVSSLHLKVEVWQFNLFTELTRDQFSLEILMSVNMSVCLSVCTIAIDCQLLPNNKSFSLLSKIDCMRIFFTFLITEVIKMLGLVLKG